jgi:peroxiredoxin
MGLFLIMVGMCCPVSAGKYNEVLSIGDAAPVWKDLPGTDGKKHSMADLKDKKAVVVVFTCASCPYSVDYEDRIQALAKQHLGPKSEVAVVAICVNLIAVDRLPKLTERAKQKGFVFQYLSDESQRSAKAYGSIFTPQFFVLNAERKVIYMGAMDDSTDATKVKVQYVQAAIQAALKGERPAVTETETPGCMTRYTRERK